MKTSDYLRLKVNNHVKDFFIQFHGPVHFNFDKNKTNKGT